MFELIKEDIAAWELKAGKGLLKYLYHPMFAATILIRLSRWLHLHHLTIFSYLIVRFNDIVFGIWVGPRVEIGGGLYLGHSRGLMINPDTRIGKSCSFMNNVTLGGQGIDVGDNVFFSIGATVYSKSKIVVGCNSIVGPGAVVVKDVSEYAVMLGNPARNSSVPI